MIYIHNNFPSALVHRGDQARKGEKLRRKHNNSDDEQASNKKLFRSIWWITVKKLN